VPSALSKALAFMLKPIPPNAARLETCVTDRDEIRDRADGLQHRPNTPAIAARVGDG
jgi:hypothetical protein